MTAQVAEQQFSRVVATLWRDTGMHVLAIPEGERTDVTVLSGGSALLWRMLDEPQGVAALVARLSSPDGVEQVPGEGEIRACLEDLVERGLVQAQPEPSR